MNVEDILKGFGRILSALEELKMTDPLDLPYEIDGIKNNVEDLKDDIISAFENEVQNG